MNLFAIYGSGFGLYGYLPALIACGQQVILPQRYLARFNARPELLTFANQVKWMSNENSLLEYATGVAFALRPEQQYDELLQCLRHTQIEHLLLEKPLAPSPNNAAILFDNLIKSKKNFRIGYTFRYTDWGKQLLAILSDANNINKMTLQWSFLAHHFNQNLLTWKRSHAAGGGVIRFYGIHIIALLAEIGYNDVILSETMGYSVDEYEKWHAIFHGPALPECEIIIDSKSSVQQFKLTQTFHPTLELQTKTFIDLPDPFSADNCAGLPEKLDRRVAILNQLCQSLWNPEANGYEWYAATIQLWLAVENKTSFVGRGLNHDKKIN